MPHRQKYRVDIYVNPKKGKMQNGYRKHRANKNYLSRVRLLFADTRFRAADCRYVFHYFSFPSFNLLCFILLLCKPISPYYNATIKTLRNIQGRYWVLVITLHYESPIAECCLCIPFPSRCHSERAVVTRDRLGSE
jgi:hypothetical protein